jgi:UDP-GlcNAc:undecaprenyl-phosphate GlcNAc-1-phosphate transferase
VTVMAVLAGFLIAGTIVAAFLTWFVRHLANRFGFAPGPSSSRHLHTSPIPRLGGIAIFTTFCILYGVFHFAGSHGWIARPLNYDVLKVLFPAAGLFLVGLIDDLRGLKAKTKLLAQVAAGCCLYYSGLHFACLQWAGLPASVNSGICLLATVFWVVLVCNAINLIDGLDGLASGAALFSMVTILTVAVFEGRTGVAMATVILAGAMLGFLFFNFNPASIFLGDSGSLFVGFMLAAFVLAEAQKQQTVLDSFAIPFLSLAVPLTDTALSVLRRFLSGHSLFGADREHIHHKLLELGLNQRQVMWILYGVSASCAVLSLFLLHPSDLMFIPVAAALLLLMFLGVRKLGYQELAEFHRIWKRVWQQKRVFAHDIALRKVAATLEKVHDFNLVLLLLQKCLHSDFDGFEISLNEEILGAGAMRDQWEMPIQRVWKYGYEEKVILTLELSTPRHGLVGSISLHRQMGSGWLMDTDLLAGSLHRSLGKAIENCISQPAKIFVETRLPANEFAENGSQTKYHFQLAPESSASRSDQRVAAASAGDD